jgi:hypothetical protein
MYSRINPRDHKNWKENAATDNKIAIEQKNTAPYKNDLNHSSPKQDCNYFTLPTSDPYNLFLDPGSSAKGCGSH